MTMIETTRGKDQACIDEAAAWMTRIAQRPLGAREKRDLLDWLSRSPLHAAALDAVRETWACSGQLTRKAEAIVPATQGRRSLALRYAAFAVVALGLGLTALWVSTSTERNYVTIAGERTRILLDDGSEIVLDGDSALNVRMTLLSRDVHLNHGRIWVDVAHESVRPFEVRSDALTVTATGTQFVVEAYETASSIYLIEGGVDVTAAGGGSPSRLAPGQKAEHNGSGLAISRPDRDDELGWRYARLLFKDEALSDAALKLKAYSGVEVQLAGPELTALRVTGAFFSEDIEAFLGAVARIHRLAWRRTGASSYELHMP